MKMLTYLLVCVLPLLPEAKRDTGAVHELRSLAQALDELAKEDPPGAGGLQTPASISKAKTADQLMQRFKAVEMSLSEGWAAARNLLLTSRRPFGLASDLENAAAMKETLQEAAYEKALHQVQDSTRR